MSPPADIRSARACLRLEALLREQARVLSPPARRLLRGLAAGRGGGGFDRRALVEDAALLLSELVDRGQLCDDTADRLWLALAGCADSQRWVSRSAAEACIA